MKTSFLRKLERYLGSPAVAWTDVSGYYGNDNMMLAMALEEERWRARHRKVLYAALLDEQGQETDRIRIRARIDPFFPEICHFMIDRPVLPGWSAWFGSESQAAKSPLASALFEVEGVEEVVFHESLVMVTRDAAISDDWRMMGQKIGETIRQFIESGQPALPAGELQRMPSEDEILERVQTVIDDPINRGIKSHAGWVRLERIHNNTIWINMQGRCQGCAVAPLDLRHGISKVIRDAVPEVGAIYDATDHLAGQNPYFRNIPQEEEVA
jgi:Fe-S cluster biogenesis protein NfuA